MTDRKKTVFISDLHLDENHPEMASCFLRLLAECVNNVDAVYILGDLFEAWVGDDDDTLFHREIIQALKSATGKGVPVYVMHGNRDFLLGTKFLAESGCKLLPDEALVQVYQTPVLLMHGDTLCTRDLAYLRLRRKFHNKILQKMFQMLPLGWRRQIAGRMRAKSMQYTQSTPLDIMDVSQDAVVHVMRKHGVNYLIHGHTHRPAFHDFEVSGTHYLRMVLGAWHEKGNMLVWDDSGNKSWVEMD